MGIERCTSPLRDEYIENQLLIDLECSVFTGKSQTETLP